MRRLLAAVFATALVLGLGVEGVNAAAAPAYAEAPDPGSAAADGASGADAPADGEADAAEAGDADAGGAGGDAAAGAAAGADAADGAADADAGDTGADGAGDIGDPEPLELSEPVQPARIVGGAAKVGIEAKAEAVWAETGVDLSYQWLLDGAAIPNADGASYTPQPGDRERLLSVAVTASKPGYRSESSESAGVQVVDGELIAGAATLSGTAAVGMTLQARSGAWAPDGVALSYRWYRDGAVISGATASKYTLTVADRGKRISVAITGTLFGYSTASTMSAATRAVAVGSLGSASPKISGSAVVGSTLKASAGSWKPAGVKHSYQWKRGGKAIVGATGASYRLRAADGGKKITVTVTGSLAGYQTTSRTSAASSAVLKKLSASPKPKITGTAKVGSTLTAQAGSWKPQPVKLSYRWYRDGKAITGAAKSSYRLQAADGGAKITLRVTGSKKGYLGVAKTSAAKQVPRVLRTATPTISGSMTVGSTLTVKRGTWTSGASFSYQWRRNGVAVRGATGSSYRLGAGDVGGTLTVTVTGKKPGYATESRTSRATGAVRYPARTAPVSEWSCPSWAPIKGNASSMIYHVPGGAYYQRTKPEECFTTEAAAQAAGYRRSKR
ncbi:MAG: hypothetical protein QM606_01940 [Leucobacter sp.]